MRALRSVRFLFILCIGLVAGAPSLTAAVECLNDEDLNVVVRSVVTRSLGRVMHACAIAHPELDERARDATTSFLSVYAEDMRTNRLAANSIMMRIYGEGWEPAFETMLLDSTASDEMRAREATVDDCDAEITRVEAMASAGDYKAVMAEGVPRQVFDNERAQIPRCQ